MKIKKSLGQNFLNDNKILSKIVECGEINNLDTILEIGPGTGYLTQKILQKNPKRIIVVEKDKNLSDLLNKKFGKRIEILNEDILNCYDKFDFDKPIKVFGNLPYNISTKILISFVKIDNLSDKIKKFIFIFQKEVADRILAKENTKNYGRLSILSSWKLESHKIIDIDPIFFHPKPKVWSTLITLTPKLNFNNLIKSKHLEYITNVFFNQRRKMIKKPMRQIFDNFEEIATKLDIDLKSRPQNITINKFLEICKVYERTNLTKF